jgi:hypothetical protein
MSRKKILLNELAIAFNDQDNVYYIIEEVFKSIQAFHKVKLIEDDYFNVVFNDICQKIFNVEAQRPSVIDLYDLNDIVIRQLTDYIIEHIEDFQTEKIIYKKQSQNEYKRLYNQERKNRGLDLSDTEENEDQENEYIFEEEDNKPKRKNIQKRSLPQKKTILQPKQSQKKQQLKEVQIQGQEELKTLTLDLTEIETMFNLDNVKSICLKTVDIINSDYIITKNNNYFLFKLLLQPEPKELYTDEIRLEINEGNYDYNQLFNIIIITMNELTNVGNFDINLNKLNNIVTLSSEHNEFQLIDGPLLDILGIKKTDKSSSSFTGYKPIFLSKRRTLPLGICLNNMEPTIYEVLYFNLEERTLIHPNVLHVYKNPISIDNIYLDFDTFNFRRVPFYVKLEIKYM